MSIADRSILEIGVANSMPEAGSGSWSAADAGLAGAFRRIAFKASARAVGDRRRIGGGHVCEVCDVNATNRKRPAWMAKSGYDSGMRVWMCVDCEEKR